MQGSKSDSFQKTSKQQKSWDDGTGKRQDNRKFSSAKAARRNNQKHSE
jgi:hypothetical protein